MLEKVAALPSTNTRIAVTLVVFVLTALRYLSGGLNLGFFTMPVFQIDWEWLGFLGLMSGLDMAQFYAKRSTFRPSPPAAPDVEDAGARRGWSAPAAAPTPAAHLIAMEGPSLSASATLIKDD